MSNKAYKGTDFERLISKKLSLWFCEDKRDDLFWRTSQSGGRATQRLKSGVSTINSCGDIAALSEEGFELTKHILIELKRGYSQAINPLDLIDKKGCSSLILNWYLKAKMEAQNNLCKYVWLIFKRNRGEIMLMVEYHFMQDLLNVLDDVHKELPYLYIRLDQKGFYLFVLESFFAFFPYKIFITFLRSLN